MLSILGSARAELRFVEASEAVGIRLEHSSAALYGPGMAAVDIDLDGDLDLYLIDDVEGNHLYLNEGGRLIDVAADWGLDHRPDGITDRSNPEVEDIGSMMPCFVDIDNDGDRDLYLTQWRRPNRLYRQDAPGVWTDLTESSETAIVGNSNTAAFGDYDRNGSLDLYVCDWGGRDHLFRYSGENGFTDVSGSIGIWNVPLPESASWSAIWYHHDEDSLPELYVAVDYGNPNFCYWNLGATFQDRAGSWMPLGHNAGASMGLAMGDFDRDGDDDLHVANVPMNDFYRREGSTFVNLTATGDPIARALKDNNIGWYTDWIDLDQDGWEDLFLVNGYMATCTPGTPEFPHGCPPHPMLRKSEPNRLWRNGEGGAFVDLSASSGLNDDDYGRSGARGDFDFDGDVDLWVGNNNGRYKYFRNESTGLGHWLSVRLRGVMSNRDGVGARVVAIVNGQELRREHRAATGYLSQPTDEVHFGLGEAEIVDALRVVWPSGTVDVYRDVPVNRRFELREGAAMSLDNRLPVAPPMSVRPQDGAIRVTVALAESGWEAVRIHRARIGMWSGVVKSFDEVGQGVLDWRDENVEPGSSYRYRLEAKRHGVWVTGEMTSVVARAGDQGDSPALPRVQLLSSHPNPFNPESTISYLLRTEGSVQVRLSVHDVAGRTLRVLEAGIVEPGTRSLRFDGLDDDGNRLGSGVYFLRLQVDGVGVFGGKLTLAK